MDQEHSSQRNSRNLRAVEAASYLCLSTSILAKFRMHGTGPTYSIAGARIVVYDIADLDAWLNQRRRRSTSDGGEM